MTDKKYKLGFSFISVIVALFIIIVGFFGILSLVLSSFSGVYASEKRLIASGLAQEGIEIVSAIRRQYIDWNDWEWYSTKPLDNSETFCVQYNTISLAACSGNPLKIDKSSGVAGVYQYDSGEDSGFYRTITLTRVGLDEIKVVSKIQWHPKGNSSDWADITAEDHLWKWK